jgi:hypothetical protein
MMAELERTVKGLQAGTAADSQQVGHMLPHQEMDSGLLILLFLGSTFLYAISFELPRSRIFSKSFWFGFLSL